MAYTYLYIERVSNICYIQFVLKMKKMYIFFTKNSILFCLFEICKVCVLLRSSQNEIIIHHFQDQENHKNAAKFK